MNSVRYLVHTGTAPSPLYLPDDETFASFWPGDNSSLLAALQNVLRQEHSGYIYLWAREGAGRSHLLHAACAELSQRGECGGRCRSSHPGSFGSARRREHLSLVCIDNIECIAGHEVAGDGDFRSLQSKFRKLGQNTIVDHRRSSTAAVESGGITGSRVATRLGQIYNCSHFLMKISCRRYSYARVCVVLNCWKTWGVSC